MKENRLHPAVFLDRDGVINQVVFRNNAPSSPWTVEEFVFCEGVRAAVRQLKAAGLPVFVVTNQPDIARKNLDPRVAEKMTAILRQTLPIDDIRVCPHDNADNCPCRKPRPGMLISLAAQWHIDLKQSFFVGDSWKDMAAGREVGCTAILLQRPYNVGTDADRTAIALLDAVETILAQHSQIGQA